MVTWGNLDDIFTLPANPTSAGGGEDEVMAAATVSAMLDEHARLRSLLRNAIAETPASGKDYWVGMGLDEVVARGESPEAVMSVIEGAGMAGGTVVLEVVSSEPQVFVL